MTGAQARIRIAAQAPSVPGRFVAGRISADCAADGSSKRLWREWFRHDVADAEARGLLFGRDGNHVAGAEHARQAGLGAVELPDQFKPGHAGHAEIREDGGIVLRVDADFLDGALGSVADGDPVAEAGEVVAGDFGDGCLVLDNQHPLAMAGGTGWRGQGSRLERVLGDGEKDAEGRTLIRQALDGDGTPERLDDAVDDREPEAGPLGGGLGGVKGLEDAAHRLLVHALARVAHGEPDPCAPGKDRVGPRKNRASSHAFQADGEASGPGTHGLDGVGGEVQERLVDLGGVREGAIRVVLQMSPDIDGGRDRGADEPERFADDGPEGDDLFVHPALAAEIEDLAHEIARAFAGVEDVGEFFRGRVCLGEPRAGKFRVADDADEDVVEIVGDAPCERADCLHLLRVGKLRDQLVPLVLGPEPRGHVAEKGNPARNFPAVLEQPGVVLENAAVLELDDVRGRLAPGFLEISEPFEQGRGLLHLPGDRAHELFDSLLRAGPRGNLPERAEVLVEICDPARGVHHEQAVADGLEGGVERRERALERPGCRALLPEEPAKRDDCRYQDGNDSGPDDQDTPVLFPKALGPVENLRPGRKCVQIKTEARHLLIIDNKPVRDVGLDGELFRRKAGKNRPRGFCRSFPVAVSVHEGTAEDSGEMHRRAQPVSGHRTPGAQFLCEGRGELSADQEHGGVGRKRFDCLEKILGCDDIEELKIHPVSDHG